MIPYVLKQVPGRAERLPLTARFMPRRRQVCLVAACVAASLPVLAFAHHSFAVFFDSQKSITITGVVTEYKFANPHGLIVLQVANKDGVAEQWKVETNSPSILRRRGWAPDTLKAGETITIDGWPGRNDAHYARLRTAKRANGELIGKPFISED